MKILFLGDIVGESGRKAVIHHLRPWKEELQLDFIIVNGENTAGGRGITPKIAIDLMRAGVSVITTGDHVWDQPELAPWLEHEPRILRPLNYPPHTPGKGSVTIPTKAGYSVGVIQVQGRSFMNPPLENPFLAAIQEVHRMRNHGTKIILVDIHAETTSEKIAMGYHLDGQVSAVIGTHTHVQTADETILPHGTAYLTDAGMCGPSVGVLGRDKDHILKRFLTSLPAKFPIAKGDVRVCGALIDIDETTGKARSIERFRRDIPQTEIGHDELPHHHTPAPDHITPLHP